MTTLALSFWQGFAIGLLIYVAVALPFAFLLGRSVRRNTEDPEPEDWLRIDEPEWVWPHNRKDAA